MGKKDVISGVYLGAADRIADLLNNELFGGSPVVEASGITQVDRTAARVRRQKDGKIQTRTVSKDLVWEVRFGMQILLFALEEQSEIHYAMPLKVMNGETAFYDKEWGRIRREHKQKKDAAGAEYLSGFGKEDRLTPVFSAVVYFGEKEWDGPLRLKEMMELDGLPEEVREKVVDYPIHVIDVRRYPHAERFRTDLRLVFGFLQRASEPEALEAFIGANRDAFTNVPEDAYDVITVMSRTRKLEQLKKEVKQEEGYDMCRAIELMVKSGEERGIRLGEERGIRLGEKRGIKLGEERGIKLGEERGIKLGEERGIRRGEKQGIELARKIFRLYMKGHEQREIAEELKVSEDRVKEVLGDETE